MMGAVGRGIRFGMLLQLAVGPVCVFIFQAASSGGFLPAESGVAGVVLADTAYVAAAIAGLAAFVGRQGVRTGLRWFGSAVLCVFGISTILSQFSVNLLPSLGLAHPSKDSVFLRALLLTISNPLTIIFWAGVFSSRVTEINMTKMDMWLFGLGAVLSTAAFLSAVAAAGSLLKAFIQGGAVMLLNIAVGAVLIFFGVKMALQNPIIKQYSC